MTNFSNLLLPIILTLFAGVGWLYKHEKEKRLQVERQLSEKKYHVYTKFIDLYFKIFENIKTNKKIPEAEMLRTLLEIKKELLIYGSDSVVLKFFAWEEFSITGKNSLVPVTDIIIEMRKDMVSPNTKVNTNNFLKSIVRDKKEYEELKNEGIV